MPVALACSQLVSEKSDAPIAASAMSIIAALDTSGLSAASNWVSSARSLCVVGFAGVIDEDGGGRGPGTLLGFLEQWDDKCPYLCTLSVDRHHVQCVG